MVAALLTFTLGAMATRGSMPLAATAGVVTVLLLQVKPTLHRWVNALQRYELEAALKLLLISVVVLPILPDEGFGPGGIFNPFQLWWMVVLVSGISFAGYVAIKLLGPRRGALMTGLFGGLASSTALTVSFSRLARDETTLNPTLAAGITLAAGMMFVRILLVVGIVNPQLFVPLALPLGLMGGVCILGAVMMAVTRPPVEDSTPPMIEDPAEIGMAVKFALFLVAVILLSHVMRQGFGNAGVFAIAGFAGLADVDAITLSIARMTENDISATSASGAIVIAALVNTLVKGGIVIVIGGRHLAWRVLSVLVPVLATGIIGLAI